jgi:hypothetical protein
MIIAQALLFKNGFRIVETADEQVECDKFSFHKTILSTHCSSAFLLLIRIISIIGKAITATLPLRVRAF